VTNICSIIQKQLQVRKRAVTHFGLPVSVDINTKIESDTWRHMRQLEEEDNIIVKWAQEDVETLYNLLNK
jgi:hypothetical protein